MGVTNAQYDPESRPVDRLAAARCDQEQRCKSVGPTATFASRQACIDQLRGNISDDLNTYHCPAALAGDHLERCMEALRSERCGRPFETLARYGSCKSAVSCWR